MIEAFLEKNNICYKTYTHPAVFTCEEADKIANVPGLSVKNLFLKTKKSKEYYLIVLPANKKANLKNIESIIGDKIRFANEKELLEQFHTTPGSVSLLTVAIVEAKPKILIEKDVKNAESVGFHPNDNTKTLVLQKDALQKFLVVTKVDITYF